MTTILNLLNSQANGIGAIYFDMTTGVGDGINTSVTNTVASGTEIQCTQTAGGSLIQWISGRVPVGGFTLTSVGVSISALESNMAANVGGRARVFKRASDGTETELGGGPFDDGAEWGTTAGFFIWTCNVTDTAFLENDRLLVKLYLTNVGTMAGGYTGTVRYDDTLSEVIYLLLTETVVFKSEAVSLPIFNRSPRIIHRRF
jgi:hypothetical protein